MLNNHETYFDFFCKHRYTDTQRRRQTGSPVEVPPVLKNKEEEKSKKEEERIEWRAFNSHN